MNDILQKILDATKASLLRWEPVGEAVIIPGYKKSVQLQQYVSLTFLNGKKLRTHIELKTTVNKVGIFKKVNETKIEEAYGIFLGDECIMTSNEEILPGKKLEGDYPKYEMIDFFYLLQRAIERKDIISALDNDLTRLLLVN
jgi:hypothetical protein